jgi:hypothetical protein
MQSTGKPICSIFCSASHPMSSRAWLIFVSLYWRRNCVRWILIARYKLVSWSSPKHSLLHHADAFPWVEKSVFLYPSGQRCVVRRISYSNMQSCNMLRFIVYFIWVHRSISDAFNAFKLREDCNFITEYWSLSSHVGRLMFSKTMHLTRVSTI